jgi:hypothetical protein
MNKTISSILLLSAITFAGACSKKSGDDKGSAKPTEKGSVKADPGSADKGSEKPAASGGQIAQLKLAYDGPAGDVSDMSMGGDPNWMVQAEGLVFSVGTPKEAKTLDSAVEDSKMYDGSKITVQEKTADGWHLEFNNTGSMGANYFVEIVRTINGTAYDCSTTAPDADTAAAATKACLSLKAI